MAWESSVSSFQTAMDPSRSGPPVESDDDESFVVLEASPYMSENFSYEAVNGDVLPAFRTNKVREMQSLLKSEISEMNESKVMPEIPAAEITVEAVASSVSKITISPDASYEEIQKQVEEVIKENETLKNIIAQNNMSMRNQYARFLMYKDDVTKLFISYKEKFNDAKIVIDKCKDENAKLAGELEVYINIKKLHEEEIINLKDKIQQQAHSLIVVDKPDNEVISELQTELAQANLKITELVAENEKLRAQFQSPESSNEELQKMKSVATSSDGESLKLEKQTLMSTTEHLQMKLTAISNDVQTLKVENQALTTKIDNLRKSEQQATFNCQKLDEQLQTKQQEILKLQSDISVRSAEIERIKNENEALQNKLSNVTTQSHEREQSAKIASSLLNRKESEIANLQQDLEKSRAAEVVQREEITGLRQDREKSRAQLEEMAALRQNLEMSRKAETAQREENSKLRIKFKGLRDACNPTLEEDYNLVRKQLSIAQQTITALETEQEKAGQEIDKLRRMIQESHNDEIFALKEQLAVFKADFDAEKESKTTLKREKDQIAEDLQNVQTRNKQLQNEVETLRARMQPKTEGYECPKCSFNFSTYQSLENHVHRCLDLDGFP